MILVGVSEMGGREEAEPLAGEIDVEAKRKSLAYTLQKAKDEHEYALGIVRRVEVDGDEVQRGVQKAIEDAKSRVRTAQQDLWDFEAERRS